MFSWFTHQNMASSTCMQPTSAVINFVSFSLTWLVNSSVLIISYHWQCLFLHETFAISKLAYFIPLLILMTNDWARLQNVAICKLKCSSAYKPILKWSLRLVKVLICLHATGKRFLIVIYRWYFTYNMCSEIPDTPCITIWKLLYNKIFAQICMQYSLKTVLIFLNVD